MWETVTSHFKAITQNVVETTFHETFLTKVLPNVQSAIHEMLKQVNDAFIKGTRECNLFSCLTVYLFFEYLTNVLIKY